MENHKQQLEDILSEETSELELEPEVSVLEGGSCDICGQKYISGDYYFFHRNIHEREQLAQNAQKETQQGTQEETHQETQQEPQKGTQQETHQETQQEPQQGTQQETHEQQDDQYKCKECTATFSLPLPLELHIHLRHKKNFKCPDCNYRTKEKRKLKNHRLIDHEFIDDTWLHDEFLDEEFEENQIETPEQQASIHEQPDVSPPRKAKRKVI